MKIQPLSAYEFIELASANKVQLIDELAAQLLILGYETAKAAQAYYRVYLTNKADARVPELRAEKELLDWQYDALKHSVSALQSTLRFERDQ